MNKQGFFRCSDPALSEIWDLGAYALETNQVPAGNREVAESTRQVQRPELIIRESTATPSL